MATMTSLLPADVVGEILQHLKDDTQTLYSGLFVNRLWCHVVVPLLWRDPWAIAKSRQGNDTYEFLGVLCGCLSEESKNLLLDLGVAFQIQYPKFDYAGYIRVINIRQFNESVTKKFCLHDQFNGDNFKKQLIEKELYLLIISRSPAIKYFRVDLISTLEHPLLNFPGAHTSFSKLNEIYCDLKRLPHLFLSDLGNISKNIQQIHIVNFNEDEFGLANLIKAQSEIIRLHLESEAACDGLEINKELEVHALSLKHFTIESPYLISATSLYSCVMIETLKLDAKRLINPTNSYESLMNSLAAAKFPHLRNLHLRILGYFPISILKVAENLVARSEGHLRSLFLHGTFKKEQVEPTLLQNIAKFCPKLKYLSVWITNSNDDIRYLEQVLSSCSLLKGIIVNTFVDTRDIRDARVNGDELLKLFGRRLSRKLCKFKFDDCLSFTHKPFTTFMDCWNQMDPLYIHVIDATIFSFNYDRVCSSFNQSGILKSFIEVDEFSNFSWDSIGENLLSGSHSGSDASSGMEDQDSVQSVSYEESSSEDESEEDEDRNDNEDDNQESENDEN